MRPFRRSGGFEDLERVFIGMSMLAWSLRSSSDIESEDDRLVGCIGLGAVGP